QAAPRRGGHGGRMTPSAPPTPRSRDGALRRLRRLTIGAAGTALGAVAVFAAIAPATIPGPADTAGAGSTTGAEQSQTQVQTSTDTAPAISRAPSSQPAHAVSGGS